MFCAICGNEIKDGQEGFCALCGSPVTQEKKSTEQSKQKHEDIKFLEKEVLVLKQERERLRNQVKINVQRKQNQQSSCCSWLFVLIIIGIVFGSIYSFFT